jgi:hypothetical protein
VVDSGLAAVLLGKITDADGHGCKIVKTEGWRLRLRLRLRECRGSVEVWEKRGSTERRGLAAMRRRVLAADY